MTIYIDPGHGGVWPKGDPGVVSEDGQKIESFYTWKYANALQNYLEERGFDTELTRKQDEYKIPYSQRTSSATEDDILISIHFDTYLGGKKLIYYGQQEESQELAESIDRFFASGDLRPSTSSRFGRLYIDDAVCPSVLVEVDRIDRASLEEAVVKSFCKDIAQGLDLFLGEEVDVEENSGQIDGDTGINTPFKRVFIVSPTNNSVEMPVDRMSIVGDKLYIAPDAEWFE